MEPKEKKRDASKKTTPMPWTTCSKLSYIWGNKYTRMGDEEQVTLDGQYFEFCKLFDNKRSGTTITLYRSDFWMRQARILDDRKVTMSDTGILFNKYSKTEITFEEWLDFLTELCDIKGLNEEKVISDLTNCGLPGQIPVVVPQYRDYFLTYKPKSKTVM